MPVLTIAAAACCLLTGSVHSSNGAAISDARLYLHGTVNATAQSDPAGAFTLRVSPGRYEFTASASAYRPISIADLSIDHDARLDVTLKPFDAPNASSAACASMADLRYHGRSFRAQTLRETIWNGLATIG
ncbi:MAG: carboxypeptidase regulatory-like domain-containing protein [Candidatus Eremiobacteraeota bacterium]|nr:carboxypeptidase regulatory-like domain-containing protein [Candidatus Eremiobacteraeota bacterium]